MAGAIPPERWVRPVVAGLIAVGVMLALRVTGNNSPTISGGLVYVGVVLLVGLVVMGGRVERVSKVHEVLFYLVPVALLLTLSAIDFGYIRENGITISTTAIVVVVVALMTRR